ncbi:hypothetical protein B566_EDAN014776, partial [Ephemera danica]
MDSTIGFILESRKTRIWLLWFNGLLFERGNDRHSHSKPSVFTHYAGADGRHWVVPCQLFPGRGLGMGAWAGLRLRQQVVHGLDGHEDQGVSFFFFFVNDELSVFNLLYIFIYACVCVDVPKIVYV